MSYYLEILSETSYQEFLNKINDETSFEEINEFFESAVIYDTSFSYGTGTDRLLGVINKAEPYSDNFTKEFDHNIYRMRKNQLIELVHDPPPLTNIYAKVGILHLTHYNQLTITNIFIST